LEFGPLVIDVELGEKSAESDVETYLQNQLLSLKSFCKCGLTSGAEQADERKKTGNKSYGCSVIFGCSVFFVSFVY